MNVLNVILKKILNDCCRITTLYINRPIKLKHHWLLNQAIAWKINNHFSFVCPMVSIDNDMNCRQCLLTGTINSNWPIIHFISCSCLVDHL